MCGAGALRVSRWRIAAGDSDGRRTECAGLPSKVDVQARHEELTCTHGPIVRNESDKVNLLNREYVRYRARDFYD
jgi:hypothetical protein